MIRSVEMEFQFKNYIERPPQKPEDMYKQSCQNDTVTIDHWTEKWVAHYKANLERFGDFSEHGIGGLFGTNDKRPAIVVGSGPSLANNIDELAKVRGIPILSCLHNFHYMVDHGVDVKYFVTLDAGAVVLEEMFEGGQKTPQEYIEASKDYTLLAYVGTDPRLFDQWKGKVLLFNSPSAGGKYKEETEKLQPFNTMVSTGGNVLGACTYIAKGIMGSNPIIFTGADFCFSYTKQFHPWKSKYDGNVGEAIRAIDIWGNSVLTWQSYYNFKIWFDWLSQCVPGIYINCTEGGLMGSYPEGNISSVRQMLLKDCMFMFNMYKQMENQCVSPKENSEIILF